ncbi:MAG: TonB family protein, partial [Chitinophagaceae bacterium]|nr:TonB family protein [Chitinophagaceae bacterium]
MLYIIQTIVYTGLMLAIYLLLLRNKSMHKFNRLYLLSTAVLPLVLPMLKLPEAYRPQQVPGSLFTGVLPEVVINSGNNATAVSMPLWATIAMALYLLVAAAFLLPGLLSYAKMRRIIGEGEKENKDGYVLLKQTGFGPGSWGRYIFLPEGDVDETIIEHERVHIALHHSLDIIFISIMQAVMWPNIFLHMLRKELVQVHEFQADAAINMEAADYSALLLSTVFRTDKLYLTHTFIDHPIKRRIMMLHKNKTTAKLRGVVASLAATCLLACIITMQSCERGQTEVKKEPVLAFTAKMPEPGYDVYEFLAKAVKYPQEAKDKGIEGRVAIKFVVDKTGKIRDAEVASKKADPILAQAAMDAVVQFPDWTPGEDSTGNKVPVYYTVPITFKLEHDDTVT